MTLNIWVKFCSLLALLVHSRAFCGWQIVKFKFVAMIFFSCHLTVRKLVHLHNSSKTRLDILQRFPLKTLQLLHNYSSVVSWLTFFFHHPHHVFVTQTAHLFLYYHSNCWCLIVLIHITQPFLLNLSWSNLAKSFLSTFFSAFYLGSKKRPLSYS